MKIERNNIKVIIFDLGGVIVNLNVNHSIKSFNALGVSNLQEFTPGDQPDVFSLYEVGRMTNQEFLSAIQEHCDAGTSLDQIENAWNIMIGEVPESNLQILENLASDHTLILLSNTNDLHIQYFLRSFNEKFPHKKFEEYFDHIYYSHEIGMRKPNRDVYQWIIDKNNLNPPEVLFIDDNKDNLPEAESIGIKTYLFPRNDELVMYF